MRPILSQPLSRGAYLPVAYCDLIERPAEFDGKRIAVFASYRYGYEWQEIYLLTCREGGKTWLEFPSEPPKEMKRAFRMTPKSQGTLNGTFAGVFHSKPGAFGDGGYKFQLALETVTDVRVVSSSGGAPETLKEAERKRLARPAGH